MSTMWGANACTAIISVVAAVVAPAAGVEPAESPFVVETARGTYNAAFA
jgi:hypothetical protein